MSRRKKQIRHEKKKRTSSFLSSTTVYLNYVKHNDYFAMLKLCKKKKLGEREGKEKTHALKKKTLKLKEKKT